MQYYIKTFGCQMNDHDSRKMEALLVRDGYSRTEAAEEADVVVINTCSVRDKSYQKAVSQIGMWREKRGVLAITGCVVSHDAGHIKKRFPFVDILLGPDHIDALPGLIKKISSGGRSPSGGSGDERVGPDGGLGGRAVSLTGFKDISDYEFPALVSTEARQVKAYVTVMKGCDNVCSFCIVPFTRGAEVSRPADDILEEIRHLEGDGVREVTLLGQNVNSYGGGLAEKTSFARLLRRIDRECRVDRIRFTSPHPKDLSHELIEEYRQNSRLCPHMHLPVQSGSDAVLKGMRRSYSRAVYLRRVEELRRAAPDIAITTDIIVGFPGETEKDFEETLSLVREVHFDASYSFSYSPRPGTEAARLKDDVPEVVKKDRLARIQGLQEVLSLEKNRSRIGQVASVLVEGRSAEGHGQLTGRTPHGSIVNFDGGPEDVGVILKLEITDASAYSLKGELSCSSK